MPPQAVWPSTAPAMSLAACRWDGTPVTGHRWASQLSQGTTAALELSPDGTRLAVGRGDAAQQDLWIKDFSSGTFTRLTSGSGGDSQATWAPDSNALAFVSDARLVYTTLGLGVVSPLPGAGDFGFLEHWTPDGAHLVARSRLQVRLIPAPREGGVSRLTKSSEDDLCWALHDRASTRVARWPLGCVPVRGVGTLRSDGGTVPRHDATPSGFRGGWRATALAARRSRAVLHLAGRTGDVRGNHARRDTSDRPDQGVVSREPGRAQQRGVPVRGHTDGQRFLMREGVAGGAPDPIEPLHLVMTWTSLVT